MDFWLTDDETELQSGMRSFIQGRLPLAELTAAEEKGAVIQRWREIAEMGVFSLRADGLGMRAAVLVFEELGRGLVPGPVTATHLAAGLVDGAADGSKVIGLLEPQPTGTLVEHAAEVDALLWFTADELRLVDAKTLVLEPVARPLDPLSPVWRATNETFESTVLVAGDAAHALKLAGVVLTSALQLGVALAAVDVANAYAHEREQFGRPIGSFQAVKHLLADMLVKAEVGRAAVYAAACALDGASDDDVDRTASVAKAMAGDAAVFCGKTGIQVHGGMGFTWEVDAQRYWKRAVVLDNTFGNAEFHALAVAEKLTADTDARRS